VGQILDYASDLSGWSYERFEAAVGRATGKADLRLYDVVPQTSEPPEEAQFIDAVSRNLRLARFLLLIVGDGIQESAEQLVDFLQRHVGLRFTMAMVQLSLWRLPNSENSLLLQPRVLMRTVQIERPIFRVEESFNSRVPETTIPAPRRTSITEETFYDSLASVDPTLPDRLKSFLAEVQPLGVLSEMASRSLMLRLLPDGQTRFNLASITPDGFVETGYCGWWGPNDLNRPGLSHSYLGRLASLLPDGRVQETNTLSNCYVQAGNGRVELSVLLDQKQEWAKLIQDYDREIRAALGEAEGTH